MKFTKTVNVSTDNAINCHVGQWIKNDFGQRGQYLGTTARGTIVIRWQNDKFGSGSDFKRDAKANRPLRQYAKLYGAK